MWRNDRNSLKLKFFFRNIQSNHININIPLLTNLPSRYHLLRTVSSRIFWTVLRTSTGVYPINVFSPSKIMNMKTVTIVNLCINFIFEFFYIWVSVDHKSIIYNKPTRCNSGSIVFIKNYKYALHVSNALSVHL